MKNKDAKRNCLARVGFFVCIVVLLFLCSCQPKVYLMPTPVGIGKDSMIFELTDDNKDENLIYTLYATNRRPFESFGESIKYTIFPSDDLRLGYVVHSVGGSKMSWEDLRRESLSDSRSKDLLIEEVWLREMALYDLSQNMEQKLERANGYFSQINQALATMYSKDIVVYVHGANCNYYRATAQGAQLSHFLGHNSIVLTFSWPSAENLLKYKTDVLHARQTVPVFARLIEILAENTRAEHINIVAYSAGAQVVVPGLAYLRDLYPDMTSAELKNKFRIGELYLAAPDTNFVPFIHRFLKFSEIVERTTINLNNYDKVLKISAIKNGMSRLGRPNLKELSDEEILVISRAVQEDKLEVVNVGDSRALKLGGAHDSWYAHPWVSMDLLLLLLLNADPEERGLLEYNYGSYEKGYYFPDDYDKKIQAILRENRESLLDL